MYLPPPPPLCVSSGTCDDADRCRSLLWCRSFLSCQITPAHKNTRIPEGACQITPAFLTLLVYGCLFYNSFYDAAVKSAEREKVRLTQDLQLLLFVLTSGRRGPALGGHPDPPHHVPRRTRGSSVSSAGYPTHHTIAHRHNRGTWS